jgi:hypothetical protein
LNPTSNPRRPLLPNLRRKFSPPKNLNQRRSLELPGKAIGGNGRLKAARWLLPMNDVPGGDVVADAGEDDRDRNQ